MNGICTGTLWPGCYLFPGNPALRDLNKVHFLAVASAVVIPHYYLLATSLVSKQAMTICRLSLHAVTQWVGVGCSVP